ncbi:MAG TPA: copper resistance protein CopC [Thermoleophilaceae bacterium]
MAFLLAFAAPASAHPSLVQAAPAAGVVAQSPPRAVVLSFTERVIPQLSSVRVSGPTGRIRVAEPKRRGSSTLTAALRGRLPPAVYTTRWVAVGDDGHTVSGSFRFGVPRAGGAPPPGVEQLGAPGVRGSQSSGSEGFLGIGVRWLALVASGLLLAGAVLRRMLRAGPDARWMAAARAASAAVLAASAYAAVDAAYAGTGHSLSVLVAQPTGVLALVRIGGVLALAGAAALAARRRGGERTADLLLGAAGYTALMTYALATHVQTVTGGETAASAVQVVHVVAAGLWMGGLVYLVTCAREARALRAFAWVAAASVAVLALTGILAAVREVDEWYFLRWSDYGRVVIAKTILLLTLGPAALLTALAARRGRAGGRALRAEALGAVAIAVLASTLIGLPPGRGQLLPAQRGNLLAGAAFATPTTGDVTVPLTVAPARPGRNTIAATPTARGRGEEPAPARAVEVTLRCDCAPGSVRAILSRRPSGTWSARATLPAPGTWYATPAVDGRRTIAPVPLAIGDPPAPGPAPRELVMTADLTGTAASRCREQAQGAILAIGRFDAGGGLDGGRKVVARVEDDGGDPARAAIAVRAARARGAVALLAPCGGGATAAVQAAGGLPTVVADPAVPPVNGPRVWRTAGEPRAEGVAVGQYLLSQRVGRGGGARSVAAVVAPSAGAPDTAPAARIAGLRAALEPAGLGVVRLPAGVATRPAGLRAALDPRRHAAVFLDGDAGTLARTLRAVGVEQAARHVAPAPVLAASPLLDERFVLRSGALGQSGAIASPTEVLPATGDGLRYLAGQRDLFRPDRASISGLRGYVAGLAIAEGLRAGTDPDAIARRLRSPRPFTDTLLAPWRPSAPAAGEPLFLFLAPRFLPSNLLPKQIGGEEHSGSFFDGGSWSLRTGKPYGPRP